MASIGELSDNWVKTCVKIIENKKKINKNVESKSNQSCLTVKKLKTPRFHHQNIKIVILKKIKYKI